MATVNTHRDLHAWREAMTLVEIVYRATEGFPKAESFGLVNQMRRHFDSLEHCGRSGT